MLQISLWKILYSIHYVNKIILKYMKILVRTTLGFSNLVITCLYCPYANLRPCHHQVIPSERTTGGQPAVFEEVEAKVMNVQWKRVSSKKIWHMLSRGYSSSKDCTWSGNQHHLKINYLCLYSNLTRHVTWIECSDQNDISCQIVFYK